MYKHGGVIDRDSDEGGGIAEVVQEGTTTVPRIRALLHDGSFIVQ